jgi:hypothetical protein
MLDKYWVISHTMSIKLKYSLTVSAFFHTYVVVQYDAT